MLFPISIISFSFGRNEKSPFRALTHAFNVLLAEVTFSRNEKSPFRALTPELKANGRPLAAVGRNEKSPFRALTRGDLSFHGYWLRPVVEMKKALLGYWFACYVLIIQAKYAQISSAM